MGDVFAVHEARRATMTRAAEGLPNRLMSEANAEDGDGAREAHHRAEADARFVRACTGRARSRCPAGFEAAMPPTSQASFSTTSQVAPERLQVLHEVVGKRVVVIDDDDAAPWGARKRAHGRTLAPGLTTFDIADAGPSR